MIRDTLSMREAGASDDEILSELRRRGCSKLQCVVVMLELGLGLLEAKTVVHESPVWADARAREDCMFDELDGE